MIIWLEARFYFNLCSINSVCDLYRYWHQFVFWAQVEQTESTGHTQSFTIIRPGWYSIHLLLVIEEDIALLYGKERQEVSQICDKQGNRIKRLSLNVQIISQSNCDCFHTFISFCREVPSSRNGFTISSVTGKFRGSSEQRLITPGLTPFRNWNP